MMLFKLLGSTRLRLVALVLTCCCGSHAVQIAAAGGKAKPDLKPFDEVVTDEYKAIDGFFPLYYNAKKDHLLAVIPQAMLGKDFLMARSLASGGRFTGFQFGHSVFQWSEYQDKLVLSEPNLRYVDGKNSTMKDVIARTYGDTIALATPIVTRRGKDPVIDLDKVFKRDRDNLGKMLGGKMDPSLSRWAKNKGFADNVELAVEGAFMSPDGSGQRVTVHYSLSRLPKTDYKPRAADSRIGYFLTARKDWTSEYDADTLFKRYIHRWHLRKAEPEKAVSDVHPDDQIVFYIEHTVPVQYRRYLREGILMWNRAFEKAGLRNAVVVRQQTANNEFAHLDPEDVNYNFFRWIVSGRAFAMGPSRANPYTGQIFDADIIMDDSMARVWTARYDRMLGSGPSALDDPQLAAFFDAHPSWRFQGLTELLTPGLVEEAEDTGWEPEAMKIFTEMHPDGMCHYANGAAHEMALGSAILNAASTGVDRGAYVGQWIRLVACHEVGHTLGLRHNFKASSWKSLDEIMSNTDIDEPTTASVMDYNPAVYNIDRSERPLYMSQAVGPYDEMAIAYGYTVPMKNQKETEVLTEIARRVSETGLDFATDEDSSFLAPDPLVNTYDHGDDPVAWAEYRMNLVDSLCKDIDQWAVDDGASYARLRQIFDMMMFELSRQTRYAARVIGGQYLHRDHKGDPDARPPLELVSAADQKAALAFLNDRVFGAEAFDFPPALLNMLAAGRWRHWDSDGYDNSLDYPIHDRVAAIQYWALFHVTNPVTINRIYDAQLKTDADADAFTVPDLVNGVTQIVWSELNQETGGKKHSNRAPFINSLRRSLQRQHLQMMTRLVLASESGPMPADAIALARTTLAELAGKMNITIKAGNLDTFSFAHLVDAETRIRKALDAGYQF